MGESHAAAHHSRKELTGIALAVVAVICFASMDTTVRWASASIPLMVALWFRYLFQAVSTTAAFWPSRRMRMFSTQHPWLHFLRGLLLLFTSGFAFFSLKYIPVGEFTALIMTVPIIVTLYASHQFKEHVSARRWVLVLGGFTGVLIIVRPGHDSFSWAWLLPLGCIISNTWFQLLTSRMTRSEDPVTLHAYTGWVGLVVCSLALPWTWEPIAGITPWLWMSLIGALGTLGHFLLIQAYARAPASVITPYMYVQIGAAMLAGWLAFSHIPDIFALSGMTLIGVCGALGAWLAVHERQQRAAALSARS